MIGASPEFFLVCLFVCFCVVVVSLLFWRFWLSICCFFLTASELRRIFVGVFFVDCFCLLMLSVLCWLDVFFIVCLFFFVAASELRRSFVGDVFVVCWLFVAVFC